jgi:hypothetical protein
LAVDSAGAIYAATEESDEHNDPEQAGEARIFKTIDLGQCWKETGPLDGANRVYALNVKRDGKTLLAGSGIRGEFYRSTDGGDSWVKRTHVPDGEKLWGDPPQPKVFPATRIYNILELADGRILVGTGNSTGDLFLSSDDGETWQATESTGNNIVCWAMAQAPDGTIWIGTGSTGGDILSARP